jgi:hypothetical protein
MDLEDPRSSGNVDIEDGILVAGSLMSNLLS